MWALLGWCAALARTEILPGYGGASQSSVSCSNGHYMPDRMCTFKELLISVTFNRTATDLRAEAPRLHSIGVDALHIATNAQMHSRDASVAAQWNISHWSTTGLDRNTEAHHRSHKPLVFFVL